MLRSTINGIICIHKQVAFKSLSTEAEFHSAQKILKNLSIEPDVETKLKLYGLYKQSTVGDVADNKAGAFDFAGKAKYTSWQSNSGISKEEAQKKYVELVNSLLKNSNVDSQDLVSAIKNNVEGIEILQEGKVFKITLNRPDKFNALTWDMYKAFTDGLEAANKDKNTTITVISGNGLYYCSGNDLSNFNIKSLDEMKKLAEDGRELLERFVRAHIEHEKPLITLVHGPAMGISVTILALSDVVIASDKATFSTPFTSLGQSPEGCSSFTFPLLMGNSKASEILLFGKKLTAEEAVERNLVSRVIPNENFVEETQRIVSQYAELPPESLRFNKQLVRNMIKDRLIETNIKECDFLKKRWLSTECHQALAKFMSRKKPNKI